MSASQALAAPRVAIPPAIWKKALIFTGFVMLALGAMITKDDPVPKWLVVAAGLAGAFYFVKSGLLCSEIMLCFLAAYHPFSMQVAVDVFPGVNFTNFLIVVNFFLWFKKSHDESLPVERTPLRIPFMIFILLGVISISRGADYGMDYVGEASIQYYRKWIVPIMFYFLYAKAVRDKETLKNLVLVMIAAITLVGLMSIYEYMDTDERVEGVFDQPNQLAAFFNYYMFIPFAFFFLNMRKPKSWVWLAPFLICLRGVMVTFSRAGYMAFVVSLYAISFFRSKKLIFILAILTWVMVKNLVLLPEGIRYRLSQTFEKTPTHSKPVEIGGQALDQSSSDRVKVWAGALFMIQEHPVFGVGYYLFESKIRHYYTGRKAHDPHNTYLHIAAEMGIPALLLFLWILWKIFIEARRLYRKSADPFYRALGLGFLAGYFGLLISNLYGSRIYFAEVSSYFWILSALIFRARKLEAIESHE